MLSLFTRQGRVWLGTIFWKNRGAREFGLTKAGLVGLALALGVANGPLWVAFVVWAMAELVLAALDWRSEIRQGFTTTRARREGLVRLGLATIFGAVSGLAFAGLPLWLAAILALGALVVLFGVYLSLNVRWLVADMRGTVTDNTPLFEQIRQGQNLDTAATQLQTRLALTRDFDARHDLTFYQAWAEVYRGHRLLPARLWDKAAEFYRRASKIDPSNQAARAALVVCLLREERFELALGEYERAVAVFNGKHDKVRYDEGLWHWQRNEVSSEYEQSAGLFQLGALAIGLLQESTASGATKELLSAEYTRQILNIPGRSQDELTRLMARRGGQNLSALQLVLAGPYRAPADPLELVEEAVTLPLLPIQLVEEKGSAA